MRNNQFLLLGLVVSALSIFNLHDDSQTVRTPASQISKSYMLEIKTLNIKENSLLNDAIGSDLRATFKRTQSVVLAKVDQNFIRKTQQGDISIKLDIDSKWVENDQLEFKLELVKTGIIDRVIVRCAQVSKKLSEYNRSYQCFLPNEEAAFISYRLSDEKSIRPSLAKK